MQVGCEPARVDLGYLTHPPGQAQRSEPGDQRRADDDGCRHVDHIPLNMVMMFITAGPSKHDEQHGQDAEHQREDHLDRDLHRLLLGPLAALDPHLGGLGVQHVGDGDAVLVGLDDGPDEPRRSGDTGPRRQRLVCLAPGPAHLDVLQGADQLLEPALRCRSSRPAPSPTSKPRPASTAMVIWSRVSGSSRAMCWLRSWPLCCRAAARAGSSEDHGHRHSQILSRLTPVREVEQLRAPPRRRQASASRPAPAPPARQPDVRHGRASRSTRAT